MPASHFYVRTVPGIGSHTDQISTTCSSPHSLAMESTSLHSPVFKLGFQRMKRSRCLKSTLISCNSSRGTSGSRSSFGDHHDNEFLEASLLLSETISHYQMLGHGFQEELHWNSSIHSVPISLQAKNLRTDADIIRQAFFQRFQNPTIFLKISCDGDYVLPIVVGKFAIEKLLDAEVENENGDCPDQYQFVKNLVQRLDHEGYLGFRLHDNIHPHYMCMRIITVHQHVLRVCQKLSSSPCIHVIMVRITKRVVSTYFARLYLSKPGTNDIVSVDARPSDAINVANRCKAPIYVSKQIVLTDAIKLGYGMGRVRNTKSTYDVLLDSPADGPDLLAQELSMMQNMNIAAKLERFKDAAVWRDKLADLRKSEHER